MLDIQTLTHFFAWCTVINLGLLIFSAVILLVFNTQIKAIHSRLLSIDSANLNVLYFNFLGNYKILILVLNLVPYCVLKIIA